MCGDGTQVVLQSHHGYASPWRFDVHECPSCDTRFAWPLRCDGAVYEQIYRDAARIPGYDRYQRLQRLALGSPHALADLAALEDVYWGVAEALRRVVKPGARVLEVGSGLGYLTHAMRQAGLDAEGVDLSEVAVWSATKNFGAHFRAATVDALADEAGSFDCVVATELLEHLEQPQQFVDHAMRLLRPGGHLILTTPNKDIYPTHWAWHTDPAPVHLWWFSRSSLRRLAWAAGATVTFVDFTPFYRGHAQAAAATKPPTLDGAGNVIFRDSLVNTAARAVMSRWPGSGRWIGRFFLERLSRQRRAGEAARHGLSHCAILKAPGR